MSGHRVVDMGEGSPNLHKRVRRHDIMASAAMSPVAGDRGTRQASVAVLDRRGRPLQPTRPGRARELLSKGRAVVIRVAPVFTIRLKDRSEEGSVVDGVVVGVDPGSVGTGIAVVVERGSLDTSRGEVHTSRTGIWLGELVHRGLAIKQALQARAGLRRSRRNRNLRYRAPRFLNRTRPPGWLPPSLRHRLDTVESWLRRLARWFPVTGIVIEQVRFDMQLLQHPNIAGVEYQQGTLAGTNVREYLLAKWERACVYCGATDVPLNIDHIRARARGGSDRVSNLTLACIPCNQAKGAMPIEEFVTDPARLHQIMAQAKAPLRDAAAVNTTRYAIVRRAESLGVRVATSTGAVTKWNRTRLGAPKTHALDALAVGDLDALTGWPASTSVIRCTGRGRYQRSIVTAAGFPRGYFTRQKRHYGFATGDHSRAFVPDGTKAGIYFGRVAVRATGSFNITTTAGTVQGLHHRHFTLIQRADGYAYTQKGTTS
ncbi:RNA-guided endonuclease IscB [Microbacterium sp. NPDC076768]|uniref:RNA-guided endonuclease IscB n=2 Tax=Microbacterium TaxID=33882 RepID=UPI0034194F52